MSTAADLEDLPTVSTSDANAPLFDTQLVLDSRLAVKSSLTFGVEKSGQQITAHAQAASSATTSGFSFEVTVPSLSTIISRKINLRTQLSFTIAGNTTVGDYLVKWGINCAAAPFAFQQMAATCNTTINNSNYTFEAGDLLAMVLRQLPKDVLDEYADTTPVFLDNYANYADCTVGTGPNAVPKRNSPFLGNETSFLGQEGRGSYNLISITNNSIGTTAAGGLAKSVTVVLDICEPLVMSPFLLSTHKNSNSQGIYGVQGMAFNFNFIAGSLNRAIRGDFPAGTTVTLNNIAQGSSFLDFTYITPHASLKLPARNLVPYLQMQKYIDPCPIIKGANSPFGAQQTMIQSNSHSLTSIPDYLTIGVRRISSGRTSLTADCWLPIQSCIINFNNTPGILSGASQYSLWEMSKNNGVNLTWNEFRGYALETTPIAQTSVTGAAAGDIEAIVSTVTAGATAANPVATTGSLVKVQFGKDINLSSDWLASSSIGQFSISLQVYVTDNTQYGGAGTDLPQNSYEMCLMFQQSGFIVTSLGSSSQYSGILSKAQVLDASQQEPVNRAAVERVYGSGMHSLSGMTKGAGFSAGKMSAGKSNMKDRFV